MPHIPQLIACIGCGQQMFSTSAACWRCGQPIAAPASVLTRPALLRMLLVVAVGVLVAVLGTTAFLFARDGPPVGVGAQSTAPAFARTTTAPAPSDAAGTHTVARNESLVSIGFAFGVTLDELRFWNRETYPSVDSTPSLEVGWVLNVAGPPLESASATPDPALATLGPEPGPGFVRLPVLTVDIWNSDVRYFPISGQTPDELLASIGANIPPPDTAAEAYAYVDAMVWDHQLTYGEDSSGACTLAGVRSTVRYRATIPQWTSPPTVRPELLAWWTVVLEHFRLHEEQHVRIFSDFVSQLPRRVTGQPCDALDAIADQWHAEMDAAHVAFDAAERAWEPPAYAAP